MKFAIIFDMDGVLVDSNQIVFESFNKILEPHKLRITENEYKHYSGITAQGLCDRWKEEFGLDFTADFMAKETTRLQIDALRKEKVDPKLLAFLKSLKEKSVPIAIGTSSPRARAESILESLGIKDFFNSIVTGDDVKKHKPDPEIFLKAAESLGRKPEECIVIEDAINGIEAAKRGGMKAVALLTENHTIEDFRHADLVFGNFSEISLEKIRGVF